MTINAVGLVCPHCGCTDTLGVTRTQDVPDAKKRYRRCFKCGNSFPTIEVVDPKTVERIQNNSQLVSAKELKKAQARMQKLLEKSQTVPNVETSGT